MHAGQVATINDTIYPSAKNYVKDGQHSQIIKEKF